MPLPANNSEYLGRFCQDCYVRYKQKQKAMAGTYKSKNGLWVCSRCQRTHSKNKNFCWECGSPQSEASWVSMEIT